jgi:hypothetical protein
MITKPTMKELYKAAWEMQRSYLKGFMTAREFSHRHDTRATKAAFAAAKSFIYRQGA